MGRTGSGLVVRRAAGFVLIALLTLVGCADDGPDTPTRASFAAKVQARDGLTREQADCFTAYLYDEYSGATIRAAFSDGFAALSGPEWNTWGHSMVACVVATDLGEAGP